MTTKVATRNPMDIDVWGEKAARRARDEREARRPTPNQERSERTRLYQLGKDELVKRYLRHEGRLWNEVIRYSAEFFVDSLMARWAKDGWVGTPSGRPLFKPNFDEIRSMLYQLPSTVTSDAMKALDDLEAYVSVTGASE